MDFLKILRSFEEFLFEAAAWLLFYPLTMWRIVRRPLTTMAYSDREQADTEERRYDDALSPPLVLLATLVLSFLISLAIHVPQPEGSSAATRTLFGSPQNLVLFRAFIFSLVPLISAASLLHRQKKQLSRSSLRAPFYAQCYLAAPCVAFISIGGDIFQRNDVPNAIGVMVMTAGAAWFLAVQGRWFQHKLEVSYPKGLTIAAWAVIRALLVFVLILIPVALF